MGRALCGVTLSQIDTKIVYCLLDLVQRRHEKLQDSLARAIENNNKKEIEVINGLLSTLVETFDTLIEIGAFGVNKGII